MCNPPGLRSVGFTAYRRAERKPSSDESTDVLWFVLTRILVLLLLLPFLSVFAWSQQTSMEGAPAHTDLQSWDELDVLTRVSSKLDVTWIARSRWSEELANPAHLVLGTDWNFTRSAYWVFTASFYSGRYHTLTGETGYRQVPMLAVTPKLARAKWTLSDRNRFGYRLDSLASGPSWFYRNRPRYDHELGTKDRGLSAFAWDEVFYFSKYAGWTRNRVAAGIHKNIGKRLGADLYYQREDNQAGTQPPHINTVAVMVDWRVR